MSFFVIFDTAIIIFILAKMTPEPKNVFLATKKIIKKPTDAEGKKVTTRAFIIGSIPNFTVELPRARWLDEKKLL